MSYGSISGIGRLQVNRCLLGLICISYLNLNAAQPLYYEVLDARDAKSGEVELQQYDRLFPGQDITVATGGYLALVSNYYHALEFKENTTEVLPQWDMSSFDRKEFEYSDLKRLKESKRRMSSYGAVAHHMPKHEITFPFPIRMPVHADDKLCLQWTSEGDAVNDTLYVTAKDIFDDELWTGKILAADATVEMDLSFLAPSDYTVSVIDRMIVFELIWGGGVVEGSPAVIFVDKPLASFAINPCQISNAVEAVAVALYAEFNYAPMLAGDYYAKAVELSDEKIFRELLEMYNRRKAH